MNDWDDPRFRENFHLTYGNYAFWITLPVIEHVPAHAVNGYITARPIPNEWSMEWLWLKGFPYAPLITVGENGSKVDACNRLGITHFIDDSLRNFDELNKAGIKCYLKTRSHNLSRDTDMRVENINEFLHKVMIDERV